ncbi:MAG: acetate--CoA ligase family protein [Pseudomonadota bacterium]|nr:acetate--CoA ligase family protein [Pseudomonadota bacterium]
MQVAGVKRLIAAALKAGSKTLSEYDSKRVLAAYGVPITRERLVSNVGTARDAARRIGYPVVLKGCAAEMMHKTDAGLVAVGLSSPKDLTLAFKVLSERAGSNFDGAFLVQEMVKGDRELMIGMTRDEQFGPSVMFGLGGIFTEILEDVSFRLAPLRMTDAGEMMSEIKASKILNEMRGLPKVDRRILARAIIGVGRAAVDNPEIAEIDINPLIVAGSKPLAVDGLIVLGSLK